MRWGLVPSWWAKPLKELKLATFNARAETVATKPMFRSAFKRNRCLIPVSGYYEWQDTPGGKQPWYFTPSDGSPALTIAGLWDEWHDKASGETLNSCTMIITEPNKFVSEVHDRMPVLLAEGDFEPWLSGAAGLELLKPAPEDALQRWPVSKRVSATSGATASGDTTKSTRKRLLNDQFAPQKSYVAYVGEGSIHPRCLAHLPRCFLIRFRICSASMLSSPPPSG